jgi:hypothetical protein
VGLGVTLLWAGAVVLLVAAGIGIRKRIRHETRSDFHLEDDHVRRIIEEGSLEDGRDEPLDLDHIEEEERRFWVEEEWDEAEDW